MSTLEKAVATYGKDMQLTVACEELSELIKEICKNIRGSDNVESITEEMADCYIMLRQLEIIFGIKMSDINVFIDEKLARLEKRMAEREKAPGENRLLLGGKTLKGSRMANLVNATRMKHLPSIGRPKQKPVIWGRMIASTIFCPVFGRGKVRVSVSIG